MTDVNRLPVLVSLQHLSFQFADGETLLDDLNLCIDHTPTGIVGRNGRGKSILARLIAGRLAPTSGSREGSASVVYVPQTLVIEPGDSIAHVTGIAQALAALERMAQGAGRADDLELIDDRWDLAERLRTALDVAGLQLDASRVTQPAGRLSGGERLKAAMAIALWRETPAQLLLLDEPTNHLDLESIVAFEQALKGFTGAMVVVSHDEGFVQAIEPTHTLVWQSTGWRLVAV